MWIIFCRESKKGVGEVCLAETANGDRVPAFTFAHGKNGGSIGFLINPDKHLADALLAACRYEMNLVEIAYVLCLIAKIRFML